MKIIYPSILFTSILLISGCSTSTNQVNKSNNIEEVQFKPIVQNQIKEQESKKIDPTPKWIINPNKENHICSIGSSNITDIATSKKIAFITAKARISEEIEVYIESKSTLSKKCNNNECKKSYTSKISQQSTNMLRGVKAVDTYKDNKHNRLYVRACTKI